MCAASRRVIWLTTVLASDLLNARDAERLRRAGSACGNVASERWADARMSAGSVVIGCFRDPAGGTLVAGDVIVVVDVVRATTTAVTAVAQGRRCFTAPSVAAAR